MDFLYDSLTLEFFDIIIRPMAHLGYEFDVKRSTRETKVIIQKDGKELFSYPYPTYENEHIIGETFARYLFQCLEDINDKNRLKTLMSFVEKHDIIVTGHYIECDLESGIPEHIFDLIDTRSKRSGRGYHYNIYMALFVAIYHLI